MKKRPLCFFCIMFLIIQIVRVLTGAVEKPPSLLEEAASGKCRTALVGTVSDVDEKERVYAVLLKDCCGEIAGSTVMEAKVLLYLMKEEHSFLLKIGNKICAEGELSLFETARNPGNFDQRSYYKKEGIAVMMWAEKVTVISEETDWIREFFVRFRQSWSALLIRYLGEYYGNTMSAVLLGEKSGLDAEMKKMYQKNGIGHLLAISGLHMSFIGMGIYGLLRRAGLSFIPAGIIGGAILIVYLLMIGPGISGLRALIMFLIRVGADMAGRDYDLLTSLFLAAALLCMVQPLYLTDAAFQLSFGAILGIALLGPVFQELFRGIPKSMSSALAFSMAVNLFLIGPMLYFYFEIPPYSVFLNLLAIPVMPVAMGAGFLGSVITLVWPEPGRIVLKLCECVLWFYDQICILAGRLPGSRFVTGRPGMRWMILYYTVLGILCVLYYLLRERRDDKEGESGSGLLRIPGGLLVLFAVGMMAACRMGYTRPAGVKAAVLDVGQGDGIVLHGKTGFTCLIDGGSSDVSDVGAYRIEPYLLSQAVDCLDYAFVTHGDEDHVSGMRELLAGQELGIRIRTLVLPPEEYLDDVLLELTALARKNGTRTVVMKAGDRIEAPENGFTLSCLGPVEGLDSQAGSNAASLVLALSYGDFDMLLTGDVEEEGEKNLTNSGRLGTFDVLKVAHHGSKNSSTDEFLDIVKPKAAIISAGEENRYGHPHKETLERLKRCRCEVYSTADSGAVIVWTDGKIMRIQC